MDTFSFLCFVDSSFFCFFILYSESKGLSHFQAKLLLQPGVQPTPVPINAFPLPVYGKALE